MKKLEKDSQDIYFAPKAQEDEVIWKLPPEFESQLQQARLQMALSCLVCFATLFYLTMLLISKTTPLTPSASTRRIRSAEQQFIPHHALPKKETWVLEYAASVRSTSPENEQALPFSTKWVKNAAYHVILGDLSFSMENYEKATAHFEKALLIFPDIYDVRESLGTAYLKQQRYEAAIEPLREAVHKKETPLALCNLGVALLATKQFEEAEKQLLRALELQPNQLGCHKNLAVLYQKTEQPQKALYHFETYLSAHRADFAAIEMYANYLVHLDQKNRAAAYLENVSHQKNEHALSIHLLLAKIEAQSTNAVKAVGALEDITRYISPNLALVEMNHPDFDPIRHTTAFQGFLQQLELKVVSLENWN